MLNKSNEVSVAFFTICSRCLLNASILPLRPPSCDHVINVCVECVIILLLIYVTLFIMNGNNMYEYKYADFQAISCTFIIENSNAILGLLCEKVLF